MKRITLKGLAGAVLMAGTVASLVLQLTHLPLHQAWITLAGSVLVSLGLLMVDALRRLPVKRAFARVWWLALAAMAVFVGFGDAVSYVKAPTRFVFIPAMGVYLAFMVACLGLAALHRYYPREPKRRQPTNDHVSGAASHPPRHGQQ